MVSSCYIYRCADHSITALQASPFVILMRRQRVLEAGGGGNAAHLPAALLDDLAAPAHIFLPTQQLPLHNARLSLGRQSLLPLGLQHKYNSASSLLRYDPEISHGDVDHCFSQPVTEVGEAPQKPLLSLTALKIAFTASSQASRHHLHWQLYCGTMQVPSPCVTRDCSPCEIGESRLPSYLLS
jgi:hypothetical protein